MTPLLTSGAQIEITPARFYWPGDVVIVSTRDGRLLSHRVIGCYPRNGRLKWLTQADAAARPDAAVTDEHLIGKVCGGNCAPALIRVPWGHRWRALGRFLAFAFTYLARRKSWWISARAS